MLLVPHVNVNRGEGDPVACDEIFRDLQRIYPDRIFMLKPPYSEREIKHVIAQCDFFVGARMHACIAALSQCTPAAAMAYSDKFLGVFRSVGVESAVIDVRSLSVGQAVAALSSIYGSREGLRSALKRAMPTVNQLTHTLLRDCRLEFEGLPQT